MKHGYYTRKMKILKKELKGNAKNTARKIKNTLTLDEIINDLSMTK